jgi:hypothetical protein
MIHDRDPQRPMTVPEQLEELRASNKRIEKKLDQVLGEETQVMTVEQDIQAEIDGIEVAEAGSGAKLDAIEAKITAGANTGGITAAAAQTLLANVKTARASVEAEQARLAADAG